MAVTRQIQYRAGSSAHSEAGDAASKRLPLVIQGGMGVGVSNWRLANAVSSCGQLGVVSGTAIDNVLVRRLQDGDPEGRMRRAMAHFPFPEIAQDAIQRFFLADGRRPGQGYKRVPLSSVKGNDLQLNLTVLGSFSEVFLAKEGHDFPVGMNLLAKIQLPNLAALYGAMLAGVDCVLMGAGIPREIPRALDALSRHEPASLRLDIVAHRGEEAITVCFDPANFGGERLGPLKRPDFLPIVSSHSLASILLKKATGSIEGFIVEGPTAGGHNAPPRAGKALDDQGQPVYGERDLVDLGKMRELGLPFWLAGGTGSPEALKSALDDGAAGVQVGTLFAFSNESGLGGELKRTVLEQAHAGSVRVFTDPRASPTGFPFKVVALPGSNSEEEHYLERRRRCDLGYLREIYRADDGSLGYRCPAEPTQAYLAKGGRVEDTVGRKCLCNALMANIELGQLQQGVPERPLLTSGDDLKEIDRFLHPGLTSYAASDVVEYLLGGLEA